MNRLIELIKLIGLITNFPINLINSLLLYDD
jgi:hypothetical protein